VTDLDKYKRTAAAATAMGGWYHWFVRARQDLADAKKAGDVRGALVAEAKLEILDEIEDNRK